jgi:hypothetical protein
VSDPGPSPFKYHLELTPAQLKLTYEALADLRDRLGPGREDSKRVIEEVLEKFPDANAIAAIRLDDDGPRGATEDGNDDENPPPSPSPPDLLA